MSNNLILKETEFTPAPTGIHKAICVDVVDLGMVKSPFGDKPKIRIVWELPETKMEDGRPFIISERFTPSLDDRANLRKLLQTWRGRDFTDDELKGFNLENIVGASCSLIVTHNRGNNGKTYANVTAAVKTSDKVQSRGDYKRVKDRPQNSKPMEKIEAEKDAAIGLTKQELANDDIPF